MKIKLAEIKKINCFKNSVFFGNFDDEIQSFDQESFD
jgi:hypothetical protein